MATAELPITLDPGSKSPLTVQLAARLRTAILDGTLRAEDSLPSSRALATELGVSRGVVVRAFEQLSGEGYLDSRGAGGTRVAVRPDIRGFARVAAAAKQSEAAKPILDLSPGRPSGVPFLDNEWRSAWRKAAAEPVSSQIPPALGIDTLRAAIQGHLGTSRGLNVNAEDVIVSAGTSDALQLIVTALRSRSDRPRVLVEDPGYPTARRVLAAAGAAVETLPVTVDGLRVEQLASLETPPDAVLVTPSHQYPLGGRMPIQERLTLLSWASANNVLILEDDYDSEFRHSRRPLPTLASLPSQADVILVGTFSKSLSPWLRCGYLIARGASAEGLKGTRRALGTPVSGMLQLALGSYIDGGGLARHIARARREYAHRRDIILERLGARKDVAVSALDGGLHAVLELAPGIDASDLARHALVCGVLLPALADYYADGARKNGLVLGYGAVTDTELTRALGVLVSLIERAAAGESPSAN
ncbi:PLP-dependent aminotransferase family protein [Paeniglutamicibacter kerguelensis]|uniref:GntR family transcriptional regulator/MocR family aminotransferase n=1 Tax=Paeniglutamicibacter kerguelensis TaxID=254788 RepID=A0ABS4XAR4_9MICC|nr:PLP-dependent aminotransferase family protein [Paeniglutamicibacter kerguelensis]MBP2385549.1 GntR family transcriptional regulator/MocR family aminotransferase [Paeniglutamicibacter kerguelensis]